MSVIRPSCFVCLVALANWATAAETEPRIEFELIMERGFPVAGARHWIEMFRDAGETHIQIRSGRDGEVESLRNLGSEQRPSYQVVGRLTRNDRLQLPGGTFSLQERKRLSAWIADLRSNGIPGTAADLAFGLTSSELVGFHQRLAAPVAFETKGVRAGDVARRLVRAVAFEFEVTEEARQSFRRNELVLNELAGISHGTALAAVLDPLGLAAAPRKKAGQLQLDIASKRELKEWWPVGWPPQGAPVKAAPSLFTYLPVEITDVALQKALDAIQPRVEIPFLYDRGSLARHEIDPSASMVSFPKRRAAYKKVLDVILYQANLKGEIRLDEAGTPFLWISPLRVE